MSSHVPSDRLGEAAQNGGVDFLREAERRHVAGCEHCQSLYGGYRLSDRLLAAPWHDVKLPPNSVVQPTRLAALTDFVRGPHARSVAPAVAAIGIVALIGAALVAPQLMPAPVASNHSPIASGATPSSTTSTVSPSGSGRTTAPGSQESEPSGPGSSTSPGPTFATTPGGPAGKETLAVTRIGGSPIGWSPDGAHILVWGVGIGRPLQIRDAGGRLSGTVKADAATWVTSSTIAIATRSAVSPPTGSPTGPGRHGGGNGPGGNGPGGNGPGGSGGETVSIIDTSGRSVVTLPGVYATSGGVANGMLVGSGSGAFTIASQGGFGSAGWSFVLWNGSLSAVKGGLPIAFSQDGRSLAVLHPWNAFGGAVTGWLEIMAVPSMNSVASFTHLSLRVGAGSLGSGYGFDAAFSPNGAYLLASGTLVNLANGSTTATGKGGWLADGTLATSSNGGLLRWQGTHSSVDARFPGLGTVEASRHGEVMYFYGDGRPPLLQDTDGSLNALSLSSVRSIGHLLISPNGRTIAFDGRAADGSSITAVAALS